MNIGDRVRVKEQYKNRYINWFANSNLEIININGNSVRVHTDSYIHNRAVLKEGFSVHIKEIELIVPNYIEEDE